jgi:hypothetical protein
MDPGSSVPNQKNFSSASKDAASGDSVSTTHY